MTSEVPSSMPEQKKKESTDSTSSSSGEDSTTCSSGTPADVATTTGNKRKLEVKPMKPSKKQKMNNNSTTPTTANNDTSSATAAAVQEEEEEPIECSICYDKIVEQGCLDCCKHEFCFDCIFTWSKTSNACPICKQRFGSIQPASIHKNNNNNNSSNSITNNGNSTDVTTNEAASTTRARVAVPTRNFRLIEDDYDDEDYEDEVLQYLPIFHQLLAASGFDGFDSDSDDDLPPGIHRAHPEHFFQLLAEGGRIRLLTRRTVQRHHNPTHQQPGSNRPEDPIVINSDDEEEPSPQNHTFPRDLPQFSTIPIQQQQDPDHGDILSFINSFPGQAGNITTTISNNINNGVRTTTTTRTFTITNNGNAGPAVMQPPTPLTTNHPGAMGLHAEQPNNVTLPRASHLLNTTNEHSIPPLNNISHHDPFMQGLIRPNLLSHSPPSPQIPPIHSHPISQPNIFNMTPANYFNPREPMGMRLNSVPFPPNNAGMPTPSFEPFRHHTVLPSLLSLPPPEHVNQFLQPQNTRSIPPLSNFLNNPPHNPGVPDIGNFRGQSTHSSPVHGSTLFDQISNRIFGNESRTGDIVADSLAIHRTLSSAFNELSTLAPLRNAPDQQPPPPHPHHQQHPPPPQQPSSNMNSANNFGFMQNHDPSRQFREFQ